MDSSSRFRAAKEFPEAARGEDRQWRALAELQDRSISGEDYQIV